MDATVTRLGIKYNQEAVSARLSIEWLAEALTPSSLSATIPVLQRREKDGYILVLVMTGALIPRGWSGHGSNSGVIINLSGFIRGSPRDFSVSTPPSVAFSQGRPLVLTSRREVDRSRQQVLSAHLKERLGAALRQI